MPVCRSPACHYLGMATHPPRPQLTPRQRYRQVQAEAHPLPNGITPPPPVDACPALAQARLQLLAVELQDWAEAKR